MKKLIFFLLLILSGTFVASAAEQDAQDATSAAQEIQQTDSASAQAIKDALSKGDTEGAKGLYKNFKKGQAVNQSMSAATITATPAPAPPLPVPEAAAATQESLKPSVFEQKMSGKLKQFGYDLFNRTVSSFTTPLTVPVGPDYVIGSGDQFTLTLWGTTEGIYNLKVTKEGEITLPKVGVVAVAGVRFGDLEKTLKGHLSKYYNDFNLSIAMGELKALTIYVVGEVAKPGSYSVSSLTTVYGALFTAGGPTKLGSLRSIQVLRSGKVVKTLDLYAFLLKGDRSQDMKLQNEDTILVPLIGPVAGVAGMVYRPAIYELKGRETISDIIDLSGGIMPNGLGGRLQLTRYADNQKKVILDVRLEGQKPATKQSVEFKERLQNMDVISIDQVYDNVWETVEISGAVEHPGTQQWRPDLRLREVVNQGQLLPKADMKRADIVRVTKDMIEKQIIPVDLAKLMAGDESQNVQLEPKDRIEVFSVEQNPQNMWETVTLSGDVRNKGNYQWRPDLKVLDIIIEGQLLPTVELTRADIIRLNKDMLDRTVIPVNLEKLLAGDESQNIALQPQDQIRVYSSFKAVEKVTIQGEVVRTGEYEINKGERLSDLLRRAGGFNAEGYPYGAVFKRKGVKNAESKNSLLLITKTQAQIMQNTASKTATALTPEEAQFAKSEQSLSQGLLENLKAMQEMNEGRVAINITLNIDEWAGSKYDLLLQDGDSITIPKRPQEVLILGEVHTPGAQIFLPGMTVKDYLDRTGGVTRNADKDEIYVVQADGYSYGADSPTVGNLGKATLQAGDAIFVPQKVERDAVIRSTKDILDILFKTAVIFATIHLLF